MKNLLTIMSSLTLITTPIISQVGNIQNATSQELLTPGVDNNYQIDANWDFSSATPSNNETITINAYVDWSQWDPAKPQQTLATITTKIDKTLLQDDNTLGNLMNYLNNYYPTITVGIKAPFKINPEVTQYGRVLEGIYDWDHAVQDYLTGWKESYWSLNSPTNPFCVEQPNNYCTRGIDGLELQQNDTFDLYFVRLV
ncbi:hypothetical protein [Spiroplasma sp. DGKH1]|uniref:hypothetical protein n=1 Tax=Spiroplasma sp. DGKH1 TaxID=3050074 RepID=UPI0034C67F2C